MKKSINSSSNLHALRKQQGVSLIIVLVFLLLSIISVLGAFRVGFLNETMVGNESDASRAQAAAEAMIRDAEQDIRSGRAISATAPWFPTNSDDFDAVTDIIIANGTSNVTPEGTSSCFNAICVPANMTTLQAIETMTTAPDMRPVGARYGLYTGVTATAADTNPLLLPPNALTPQRAWYWIEALRYANTPSSSAQLSEAIRPEAKKNVTYRITALALGQKPGTRVVLKSIFVPFPASQNP